MTGILITEPKDFPAAAFTKLAEIGTVFTAETQFDQSEIAVIFVRLAKYWDASELSKYPRLKFIVSPTTGLNHIDLEFCASKKIYVLSLKGHESFLDNIHATSEHTVALVLALIRKLPAAWKHTSKGFWNRYPFKGTELHGRNVLLLGYGRIGRQMERLYSAFGCNLQAYDIVEGKVPDHLACDFHAALTNTDVLSIHVSYSKDNRQLVDERILLSLPQGAIVINTSRGELVDQMTLFRLLEEGHLAGAALDVLADEPNPLSPVLLERISRIGDRLIITPHIGGFTWESLAKVEQFCAELLVEKYRNVD